MGLFVYKVCEHCGEKFPVSDVKHWGWKMTEKGETTFYCSNKCYSAEFCKKYKPSTCSSRVSRYSGIPIELERAIRSRR